MQKIQLTTYFSKLIHPPKTPDDLHMFALSHDLHKVCFPGKLEQLRKKTDWHILQLDGLFVSIRFIYNHVLQKLDVALHKIIVDNMHFFPVKIDDQIFRECMVEAIISKLEADSITD